eukprot:Rhum_TRINITY_DN6467_c0_g1::Rhum_TRINITY_DN6467_c0_g1_i1::g.20002::m.20002
MTLRAALLLAAAGLCLAAPVRIPDTFQIVMQTDVLVNNGVIKINVTSAFAPLGTERLYHLVRAGYYTGAPFFRVVPDFVVQWGIAAEPNVTARWNTAIRDDPVEVSNDEGTVSFASAGPDTRTAQLFVNLADNKPLDAQGFTPVGQVVEGMDVFRKVNNPTPDRAGGVDQVKLEKEGNAFLKAKFPRTNYIKTCTIA